MAVSEIWRRSRRLAWKPWTAEFEDEHAIYSIDALTARSARRQAEAFRNALVRL